MPFLLPRLSVLKKIWRPERDLPRARDWDEWVRTDGLSPPFPPEKATGIPLKPELKPLRRKSA